MALLNEVGKAIGKVSQGISDAAKTVNDAAQETRENIAMERQQKAAQKEAERVAEKEKEAEMAHKCPKCGQELNAFEVVCPLCGYELKNAKTVDSISELTKQINRLNQKRNTVTDAIAAKLSGSNEKPTDEKIASLINNFVVPNTKEDIIEFMILASGYMDAKFLAGKNKVSDIADVIIRAWSSKFEQTFQKAKISFEMDADFSKIEGIYYKKMQEIEEAKKRFSLFGRK